MGDLAVMGIKGWGGMTQKKEVWRLIVERPRPTQGCSAKKERRRRFVAT
jgi:hypothetical protein